jgi:hypothetical protein
MAMMAATLRKAKPLMASQALVRRCIFTYFCNSSMFGSDGVTA